MPVSMITATRQPQKATHLVLHTNGKPEDSCTAAPVADREFRGRPYGIRENSHAAANLKSCGHPLDCSSCQSQCFQHCRMRDLDGDLATDEVVVDPSREHGCLHT